MTATHVLMLCGAAMWYALGVRAVCIARGDGSDAQRALIRTLAAVAPLLGLLGTVSGMIETFDALASMQMFRRGGGIGGGIAEALVSTQLGLVVAVPGLLLGRVLDRWEASRCEA